MAISSSIVNEIKRKASLGIKLTNPTAEKQKMYDSYRSSPSPAAPSTPSAPKPVSSPRSNNTVSYANYVKGINDVNQLKDIYDKAKVARASQSSLDAIHNRADAIRGYKTDPSGTYPVNGTSKWDNSLTDSVDPTPTPQPQQQYERPGLKYKPPAYTRPDYTPLIKNRFSNLRNSTLAKLKASKESALNQYAGAEDIAQQTGREALDQNDVERAKALQSLRAAMEASGQYGGGENVTGNIGINTTAQQNANLINQDVLNRINKVKAAKDLINKQAADNEVAMQGDLNAQETDALLNANQYADGMDFQNNQFQYKISKDAQDRLDKLTQVDTQNSQWQQTFDTNEKWREYEAKFQEQDALWNKNLENPAVQSQILANKASLLSNQLAELELKNYPQEQKLMLDKIKKEIARIGAQPTMTQYDIDYKKAQLDKIRAETEKIRSGSSDSGDPNTLAVAEAMSQGNNIVTWFDQNKLQLANDLNQSTYSKIAKMAEDKRNSGGANDLLNQLGLDNLFR